MGREILFRGKRVDNGEWVEAQTLFAFVDGTMYMPNPKSDPADAPIFTWDFNGNILKMECRNSPVLKVDPATVGQYTGLKDRNGRRIFEGDIVKYTFDSPDDPTATEKGLEPIVGRVFWSEWRTSFAVTAGRRGSSIVNNDVARYVRGRSIYEYVRGANTVEVIGNIHDNKNLLKNQEVGE